MIKNLISIGGRDAPLGGYWATQLEYYDPTKYSAQIYAISADGNGNLYYARDNSPCYVGKLNSSGAIVAEKSINGGSSAYLYDIACKNDSLIGVGCTYLSSSHDGLIVKFDSELNLSSYAARGDNSTNPDYYYSVARDDYGSNYISYYNNSANYIVKFSSDLSYSWIQSGGGNTNSSQCTHMVVLTDNSIVQVGAYGANYQYRLTKMNGSGTNSLFGYSLPDSNAHYALAAEPMSGSKFVMYGYDPSPNTWFIMKFNNSLVPVAACGISYANTPSNYSERMYNGMTVGHDDSIYTAAVVNSSPGGVLLCKFDSNCTFVWAKLISHSSQGITHCSVSSDSDALYVSFGSTSAYHGPMIMRVPHNGTFNGTYWQYTVTDVTSSVTPNMQVPTFKTVADTTAPSGTHNSAPASITSKGTRRTHAIG